MDSTTPPAPDPDQAWKALSLVNDWIKHADTKVAATLAATAATAIALFNLANNEAKPNDVFIVAASGCGAILFWTVCCALAALTPRRRATKDATPKVYDNLLFYNHIANAYPSGKKAAYVDAFSRLTMDDAVLTKHIAEQVHANAAVADQKFGWVDKAIGSLALAVGFFALAAIAAVWK